MIKNFLKFNESLGISSNIENECNRIFDEIHKGQKQKEYHLYYKNDLGKFPFILIHNPKIKLEGYFRRKKSDFLNHDILFYNCIICLKSLEDKPTLFHELKHLDFFIRNKKNYEEKIDTYLDLINSKSKSKKFNIIKEILYVYGENEFQSKYHNMYFDFNEYIKNNISSNPTNKEIIKLFNSFFNSYKDKTHTWYLRNEEFKFRDYLKEDELYYGFYHIIDDNYLFSMFDILKDMRSYLVYLNLNKHQLFTSTEKRKINKFISQLEKNINKKIPVYRKKLLRLITLMSDKWVK